MAGIGGLERDISAGVREADDEDGSRAQLRCVIDGSRSMPKSGTFGCRNGPVAMITCLAARRSPLVVVTTKPPSIGSTRSTRVPLRTGRSNLRAYVSR